MNFFEASKVLVMILFVSKNFLDLGMKIALIGYGKMGQLVEQAAKKRGHQISVIFTRQDGISSNKLKEVDLAIDFSTGSSALEHLSLCLSVNKPLVIGTTGWENQLEEAKQLVLQGNGSCFYAPNFSIGLYLFQQTLRYAAALFQPFQDYDVCGIEYHHSQKKDRPSGTAKALTQDILKYLPRAQDFSFSSIRCGHMPGTHTLQFDSMADTLTFTHQARSREGFAEGAIQAGEWLGNRKGFFILEDMMQNLMGEKK